MAFNFEDIEQFEAQIQDYLAGQMNDGQLLNFEKLLNENSDLKDEVNFRKKLKFVYQNSDQISFNDTLSDIFSNTTITPHFGNQDLEKKDTATTPHFTLKILLLLGIVGLIALSIWGTVSQRQTAETNRIEQVINQHLSPFENIINTDTDGLTPLSLGMNAYDQQDYKTCIDNLLIHTEYLADDNAKFYLATAYLLDDQAEKSLAYFVELDQINDPLFDAPVQWYLSLAYLKLDETESAKKILLQLLKSNRYKREAQELLDELEK